jgi:MFS family permease
MLDSARITTSSSPTPLAAFRSREFRLLQVGLLSSQVGLHMQGVAIGWQLYELTGEPLDLGYAGLAQFLPVVLLSPFTGYAADVFDRGRILVGCHLLLALAALMLLALAQLSQPPLAAMFGLLVLVGAARSFLGPTAQALMPNAVPPELLPNAIAWNSSVYQLGIVSGPALGGALYAIFSGTGVYTCTTLLELLTLCVLLGIRTRSRGHATRGASVQREFSAGLRFVWSKPVILGALSLDMVAVLLGSAVALLPVYARDILRVGPQGLGLLRSAPAVGAILMGFWLARSTPMRRAGAVMLVCVAAFGIATMGFGLSRSFGVSLVMLALTGAVDMVSVFIRHSLVQLQTPDAMRGRVGAVSMVFIGASNELGQFESGLLAHALGPVPAVVLGGVGTCVVAGLWSLCFPALRRADRLDGTELGS